SAMCRRVGCYAGVNADYFDAGNGEPAGGVVSGGRLVRSPLPGRPQLNVGRDGRLSAGLLDWSATVTGNGRTVTITGINVPYQPGNVVLYTPAWAGPTPEGADIELIVKASGGVGTLGATTPLEIIGVRRDRGPIPAGGAVLAASGSASAGLHEFAERAAAGGNRALELRVRAAIDIVESVGGSPVLLRNGQFAFPDVDDSFTRGRHPRSLVGWNATGEVVLVTVDGGRDGAASGMTLAEAAELLRGLGATEGFGFNHGAATFVAAGEVQNRPVDDVHPNDIPTDGREVAPGHFERPAANAFMVVPRPVDTPPGTNPGADPGTGPKPTGGTTATTAPGKLTTAGGGGAPATGTPAAPGTPGPTTGTSVLPGNVAGILKNPATKRPRRQTDKSSKGKKAKDGEFDEEVVGDPSIPDWNDITAALTPEQVAAAKDSGELSLGSGALGAEGTDTDYGAALLQLIAAGMIGTVVWGLRRAHDATRPRAVLWY
ncbi:MAG TPA: phosphodiester glycosidase family protein, partial [Acidimicrobiia bacterium]|nr:phosphodiester glycosidase family protein [Acidimicrobiia bacterium]